MARKTKYDPDTFPLLAEQYAREGLNDEQIAEKLGISPAAYYDYQNKYSEFSESIKRGKRPANIRVENAMLRAAEGYEYIERQIEYIKIKNPDARKTDSEDETNDDLPEGAVDPNDPPDYIRVMKVKETVKEVQPNVTSGIFWLVNREPKRWKNIQQIEHSGSIRTISDLVKAAKMEDQSSNDKPAADAN